MQVINERVEVQINHFAAAAAGESKTASATVKLTPTQKEAMASFCSKNNLGMSTVISDALDLYFEIHPYADVCRKKIDVLRVLLQSW
jgi:GH24 family phage-related lysozyme (muramidase)